MDDGLTPVERVASGGPSEHGLTFTLPPCWIRQAQELIANSLRLDELHQQTKLKVSILSIPSSLSPVA